MTKKTKSLGVVLLLAFMGMLAMPLLSAPAVPLTDYQKHSHLYFENGDDYTSQWLIRSVSESEEQNVRSEAVDNSFIFFSGNANHYSNILKARFIQTNKRNNVRLPKERIYLNNSILII